MRIRVLYDTTNKQVSGIFEDVEGTFTAYPSNLAAVSGEPNVILDTAITLDLQLNSILDFFNDNNIQMNQNSIRVSMRRARCNAIEKRFLDENAEVTITPQAAGDLMNLFMPVMLLFKAGEARTALSIIQSIPNEAFVLTPSYATSAERKQSYIDELQGIINDLFDPMS